MENRLMTIMFLDMKGYTKRSAKQTIEEMKLFHDQMFTFVKENIEKKEGVMVKTMGDGFMARFDSPTNAVQAGIEVQKKLETRNAQMMNPESIVRFRIGINTGEVGIDENGDLFGDPVNIAARIQTFADPNDVFIAESTYLAMNRNHFGAVDLGAQDLKNATREIKIYKVLKNGSPGLTMKGPKSHTVKTSDIDKKRYAIIAGIASIVIVSLILGFFFGTRRTGRGKQKMALQNKEKQITPDSTKVAEKVSEKKPVSQDESHPGNKVHGTFNSEEKKLATREHKTDKAITPLDLPADFPSLQFSDREKHMFEKIKDLRKDKQYDSAILKAKNSIRNVSLRSRVFFALIIGQLYWEKGKKQTADKIFNKILSKKRIPRKAKRRIRHSIKAIKNQKK